MTGDPALEVLTSALPKLTRIDAVIRFDLGDGGAHTIDARIVPAKLADDGSLVPDCTIKVSVENLTKLINGEMDPMLAYTLGRIKVLGSMEIAIKLMKAIT